ncbi:MAG: RibD family protein [Fusobacteriaceae bacterium]
MSNLVKFPFPVEDVKVSTMFQNEEELKGYTYNTIHCDKIQEAYGHQVNFPAIPEDRPYLYAMYVMSLDGKICYGDSVHGPYIAAANMLDRRGGDADFWMLSLTRALADGVLKGANTIMREPEHTAHVFDQKLVDARVEKGLPAVPTHVVVSLNGQDIPFNHRIFNEDEVPVILITSPEGAEYIKNNGGDKNKYVFFNDISEVKADSFKADEVPVVFAGEGLKMDNKKIMAMLRKGGMRTLTIESPVYTHVLLMEEMLDEMWINYSMVYSGGAGRSLGENMPGFTPTHHPHAKILTLQTTSPSFLYIRYKMFHGLEAPVIAMK